MAQWSSLSQRIHTFNLKIHTLIYTLAQVTFKDSKVNNSKHYLQGDACVSHSVF